MVTEPLPEDAPVLRYRREGGFAGFCDELTVTLEALEWQSCTGQGATLPLPPEERTRLRQLLTDYAAASQKFEDNPGGADNLSQQLSFLGRGGTPPSEEILQELTQVASELISLAMREGER